MDHAVHTVVMDHTVPTVVCCDPDIVEWGGGAFFGRLLHVYVSMDAQSFVILAACS